MYLFRGPSMVNCHQDFMGGGGRRRKGRGKQEWGGEDGEEEEEEEEERNTSLCCNLKCEDCKHTQERQAEKYMQDIKHAPLEIITNVY